MLRKLKTRQSLKHILIALSASPFLIAAKCEGQRPDWTAKFWAGDSKTQSILRAQDNESIPTESPEFDNYVCLTYEDVLKLETEVLSNCKKWSKKVSYSFPEASE